MKTEYLYAILDAHGRCRRIGADGSIAADLAGLLADGWRPVRETAYPHGVGEAPILLVLEREVEGKFGFGFNPG